MSSKNPETNTSKNIDNSESNSNNIDNSESNSENIFSGNRYNLRGRAREPGSSGYKPADTPGVLTADTPTKTADHPRVEPADTMGVQPADTMRVKIADSSGDEAADVRGVMLADTPGVHAADSHEELAADTMGMHAAGYDGGRAPHRESGGGAASVNRVPSTSNSQSDGEPTESAESAEPGECDGRRPPDVGRERSHSGRPLLEDRDARLPRVDPPQPEEGQPQLLPRLPSSKPHRISPQRERFGRAELPGHRTDGARS